MGDTEAMMEKEKEAMMGENGAVISPEESKPVKKLDADKIYRIIGSTGIDTFHAWIQVFSFAVQKTAPSQSVKKILIPCPL